MEARPVPRDRGREEGRRQEVRNDLRGLQAQRRARRLDGRLSHAARGTCSREVRQGDIKAAQRVTTCRNALYEWDCPEYRRNYGEPLQEEWWKYQEIRLSPMTSRPEELFRVTYNVLPTRLPVHQDSDVRHAVLCAGISHYFPPAN